jgi:hypothetical protein
LKTFFHMSGALKKFPFILRVKNFCLYGGSEDSLSPHLGGKGGKIRENEKSNFK